MKRLLVGGGVGVLLLAVGAMWRCGKFIHRVAGVVEREEEAQRLCGPVAETFAKGLMTGDYEGAGRSIATAPASGFAMEGVTQIYQLALQNYGEPQEMVVDVRAVNPERASLPEGVDRNAVVGKAIVRFWNEEDGFYGVLLCVREGDEVRIAHAAFGGALPEDPDEIVDLDDTSDGTSARTVLISTMIAVPLLCLGMLAAGTLMLRSFVQRVPEIITRAQMDEFKKIVARCMRMALVVRSIGWIPPVVLVLGFVIGELVWLDLLYCVVPLLLVVGVAKLCGGIEERARALPVREEALRAERNHVVDVWVNQPRPDW
ncbi:MAG: hypothetical protein HYY16_02935 [Planctomycetes bacterium]|nr:hypothetical protein [Planctomycetota bacterium]